MDQDALLAVWDAQLELFSRIAVEAGLEAKGLPGSRVAAKQFAEALTHCVTLASATECVHTDPKGAELFLHQANEANWVIYDSATGLPTLPADVIGPFNLLSSFVTMMLDQLQRFDPDNFDYN